MAKRNLYLNSLPVKEARERYMAALRDTCRPSFEEIAVVQSLGRVTRAAVYAKYCSPLCNSAAMDSIAVRAADTTGADENAPLRLKLGEEFIVVDTGDPVRPPLDAVIMAEDVQEADSQTVVIRAAASPWQHVRPVGEDIVAGEMLLGSRHQIRPVDIGVLLSGGITSVEVYAAPRVAILPTGTELIEPDQVPKEGDILESNTRMFEGLVQEGGGIGERFAPIPDDYALLKERVSQAVEDYDMVLINAGSSAGTEDYTAHVLRELGDVVVHGVAMKPGKPVILAVIQGKPVIGLPGYPVSAYLAFKNFAAPVLECLSGRQTSGGERVSAVLTRQLVSSLKYREYVRVKVGEVDGRLVAAPLARGAGAAMSLVRADGFCVIEQDSEGAQAGETVPVELFRSRAQIEGTLVSIGSHDLILDVIADLMPVRHPGYYLSSSHVGSMAGLMSLSREEAHMAPIHLLEESNGEYNVPYLRRISAKEPMALIKGVGRIQGLMVAKGNPKKIQSIQDLTRFRYVNRQRGAGTRILLDYLLKKENISPMEIEGYTREAATHMAVAAAVADGGADAGMGVFSAARAMGLDFIPIGEEEYDFALPKKFLELPQIKAFLETLTSPELSQKLEELGGYSSGRLGEIIIL
ncbi:molybdopterin biosynthesis protein [Anaerotruncus colihominis]|uniref:Molybdopterin molybdenumtransferase n=1 Tax=Anaerotruncus colihominis TaxID=169435 RepID=A0A845SSD6_9FIRM|nr:molybdopterin biosynthesis protein [Anaerotruncus colihominis]MCR2024014.1 molybdopterin biosynthesis protein [Anaerotruncus colihominis]NDO39436.1 molybdopterin biosynthesis protein [Anaerotruncus colihominis]